MAVSNIMKTKLAGLAALLFLTIQGFAQTNQALILKTNILRDATNFRIVNGQLYNTAYSSLWQRKTGKITDVQSDGVVLQTFTTNNVYQSVFVEGHGLPGSFSGTSDHYEKKLISSELLPAQIFFIRNYRIGAVDQTISVSAIKTGVANIDGKTLEAWDCGTPHMVTNVIAIKK